MVSAMAKVIVLGGCGAVGSVAARTLASAGDFSEVIIGDINIEKAKAFASSFGTKNVRAVKVDAADPQSTRDAIRGADIVLNCIGPFYLFVKGILSAATEARINYVDICDDVDATYDILNMDDSVKRAGITALIGMGSSPGVTNILAKLAATTLLEEVESIDIYHAHGGEPIEGEGVIAHRFHCMSIDIPQFLDGELKTVKFFSEDGIALQEKIDFPRLGKGIRVYPYPHPEQVTLPRYIKARRVTNKGTVLPDEYYKLITEICRLGLHTREPLEFKGKKLIPYEVSIAYILKRREEILKQTNFGPQRGCVKVVVAGKKGGKKHSYVFSLSSGDQALGEGTGIPAAMGVILMQRGKVTGKGVLPPEGCLNPMDFVGLIGEIVKPKKGGASFEGVILESIDETGKATRMEI